MIILNYISVRDTTGEKNAEKTEKNTSIGLEPTFLGRKHDAITN